MIKWLRYDLHLNISCVQCPRSPILEREAAA